MTVDGSTPGSAFLGTKEWSVSPETCEAAEVGQGSTLESGGACSISVKNGSPATSLPSFLSSVAASPAHADGSPGIVFLHADPRTQPPSPYTTPQAGLRLQPPSAYTSGSDHVPIPSIEGEYHSPQSSSKKQHAKMAIRRVFGTETDLVREFHETREPADWGMRKEHVAPSHPETAECSDSTDAFTVQMTQVTGCFCGQKDTETRMVICDGAQCDLKGRWLHFMCVGIEKEPHGKEWFCPWCHPKKLKRKTMETQLELSDEECKCVKKPELVKRMCIRASLALGLGSRVSPLSVPFHLNKV